METALDVRLVLVTVGDLSSAQSLGRSLVEQQLVACVNIIPQIQSIYRWQGSISVDQEVLLLMKTTETCLAALEQAILALHCYAVPEIISVKIDAGQEKYLQWLKGSCSSTEGSNGG